MLFGKSQRDERDLTRKMKGITVSSMSDEILSTIQFLSNKVKLREEEANDLKRLINKLCSEANIPIRYPQISDASSAGGPLRADQFYGQTLTTAIRNYLDYRKASELGPATVADIFKAITDGGYKFDAKSEEIAKISVRSTLRKSSSIFHRLPNGQYGLLAWYPNAKAQPEIVASTRTKTGKGKKATSSSAPPKSVKDTVTNQEIRAAILAQQGEFQVSDIETAIRAKFPSKELPESKISSVLFLLKKKSLVSIVKARSGKKGAVWKNV